MNYYSNEPLSFRTNPDGLITPLPKPQHRMLARYFAEQRDRRRSVLGLEVIVETGIEQWAARKCEMMALGMAIVTEHQPNPSKGDRRKLFRLSDDTDLVEGGGNG